MNHPGQTAFYRQIMSLPDLVEESIAPLRAEIGTALTKLARTEIREVYLAGCGDSHHAGLATMLAFEELAGIPCQAITAMQFGRYKTPLLSRQNMGSGLLFAISASGHVSRTIEAARLARAAGLQTVAVTANHDSPLARSCDVVIKTGVAPLYMEPPDIVVPGTRSFYMSLLGLLLAAVELGGLKRARPEQFYKAVLNELAEMPDKISATLDESEPSTRTLAEQTSGMFEYVFCGSGPNFGIAHFCAAKMIEACGDSAKGQDLEEWAHVEYFTSQERSVLLIISAGKWDWDRVIEVAEAAKSIGRKVFFIAPADASDVGHEHLLRFSGPVRECLSPLLSPIPALLFSASRSEILNEAHFCSFGGGRSIDEGGGISRIRTSHQLTEIPE